MPEAAPAIYVSTACAGEPRALEGVLERYARAGLHHVELSAPHPHVPSADLRRMLREFRTRGLSFLLHNYFPPPRHDFVLDLAAQEPSVLEQTIRLVSEALRIADEVGAPLYSVHAGYRAPVVCGAGGALRFQQARPEDEAGRRAHMIESLETILEFEPVARGRVALAVENLFPPEPPAPNHSFLCGADEIASLLDRFEGEGLGLLLDLANLDVASNLLEFDRDKALDFLLRWYAPRIREVHLSGNDRRRSLHRPLARDDWPLVAARLVYAATRGGAAPFFTVEARGLDENACLRQRDLVLEALA